MSTTSSRPQQAYCEDAPDSDDNPTLADGHAAPRSNSSVKRSSSSDVGKDKPQPSAASDSGYSSRTAATVSSADSAKSSHAHPEARTSPPKQVAVPEAPSAPTVEPAPAPRTRRRTTVVDHEPRRNKTTESPSRSRPIAPTTSVRQDRAPSQPRRSRQDSKTAKSDGPCGHPQCVDCRPARRSSMRVDTGLLHDLPFRQYPPSPSRSYYQPDIPPVGFPGPPSEPLRRTHSASRPTPKSYYSGSAISDAQKWGQSQMAFGPPPSIYNQPMQHPGFASTAQTSHHPHRYYQPGVLPPHSPMMQVPPPLDQRPGMLRGSTLGDFDTRRSSFGYGGGGPPVIMQDRRPADGAQRLPNPRYGPATTTNVSKYVVDNSEDEPHEDDERQAQMLYDRTLMPPPVMPMPPIARRPSLRQSRTSNNAVYTNRQMAADQSESDFEEVDYYDDPRYMRQERLTRESRGPSRRRPSVTSSDRTRSYHTNSIRGAGAEVVVASPRQPRRYRDELREKRRGGGGNEIVAIKSDRDRRRSADVGALQRDAQVHDRRMDSVDQKIRNAQAHLFATGGVSDKNPIDSMRMPQEVPSARKPRGQSVSTRSRAPSNGDRGSHISERSTATRDTNGDFKISLNASTGLNVELNGDMDGKTLSLRPGGDGKMEMVFMDKAQREKRYYEDGSRVTTTTGRKSSRSGREEISRTSSRSERERERERERQRELEKEQREREREHRERELLLEQQRIGIERERERQHEEQEEQERERERVRQRERQRMEKSKRPGVGLSVELTARDDVDDADDVHERRTTTEDTKIYDDNDGLDMIDD
ncbi:hypothetical protein K490DRAFT_59194 [Saccharata proteae CBS 121410]|uniref:Uncharacterized protein n=1 Tax=Saccharata proteae CBS 121410 TaxID=1314787 RepID=A0A9P4HQL2_9PEZI|nr:hypothetical protein K490DRAFT_59194 [Saccharata proteae CBS 121410]